MHEASITESIMNSVLDILEEEGTKGTVTTIHITTGVCQGLIPESMQMFFDMTKPDTRLADAELVVTSQEMVAYCPQCDAEHELDIPVMFCPDCGTTMTLTKGNEIIITSIEVEE